MMLQYFLFTKLTSIYIKSFKDLIFWLYVVSYVIQRDMDLVSIAGLRQATWRFNRPREE